METALNSEEVDNGLVAMMPCNTALTANSRMNVRLVLVVLVLVSCCTHLTACKQRPQAATVTAEVYQEFHTTTGDSPDTSPVAYRVNVTVKNGGAKPIVFDTVVCAFVPANGKPLLNKTYVYDETRGYDQKAYDRGLKTDTIEPGAVKTFSSTTDGYTFKLLRDTGGLPLQFIFTLLRGDSTPALSVIGSHSADLPNIPTLPQYSVSDTRRGKDLALQLRE